MNEKEIQYIFTHGYCDLYAYYFAKNNNNITGFVGLLYEDPETEESNVMHVFATDGKKLYDILGNIDYSEYDAIKHVKQNMIDLFDDYDDINSCYLEEIDLNEIIWEERLNMILEPIGNIKSSMTAINLIKHYEDICSSKVKKSLPSVNMY